MFENPRPFNPTKAIRIVILKNFSVDFISRIATKNEFQKNIDRLLREGAIQLDSNAEFEKYNWIHRSSTPKDNYNIILIENDINEFTYYYY